MCAIARSGVGALELHKSDLCKLLPGSDAEVKSDLRHVSTTAIANERVELVSG